MRSKTYFWLRLHQLATDLHQEGESPDQRAENLATMYESLGDSVQAVYGENLEAVMRALTTIALRCRIKPMRHSPHS
jgi:transketolase N-terminal domain/subunit